jgi:hypothetical protein
MKITQHTEHDTNLTGWWNATMTVPPFNVQVECICFAPSGFISKSRQFVTLDQILHTSKGIFPSFTNDDGDDVSVVLWRYLDELSQPMLDKAIEDYRDKYDRNKL